MLLKRFKLFYPVILLSSVSVFSLSSIASSRAQSAPGTKINYKSISVTQSQCIKKAKDVLVKAESATSPVEDRFVVWSYAGSTTITITCIADNRVVVFAASGFDSKNLSDWVSWLYRNF